jgi:hypothetical protein
MMADTDGKPTPRVDRIEDQDVRRRVCEELRHALRIISASTP